MSKKYSFCTIDLGNSRIKAYFKSPVNSEPVVFYNTYNDNFESDFLNYINKILDFEKKEDIICAISSVNPNAFKIIENILTRQKIRFFKGKDLLTKQKIICFELVEGLGEDRAFGMLGATDFFEAPFITIDCGTAITVNLVIPSHLFLDLHKQIISFFDFSHTNLKAPEKVKDFSAVCLGGCIFPGFITCAKALNHYTSQLPLVEIKSTDFLISNYTAGAINTGIINIVNSGINELINNINTFLALNEIIPVVVSGGGKEYLKLAKYPENKILYCDNLINLGLEKILKLIV